MADSAKQEQCDLFMRKLDEKLESAKDNAVFLTETQHELIGCTVRASGWQRTRRAGRNALHKQRSMAASSTHGSKNTASWQRRRLAQLSYSTIVATIRHQNQIQQRCSSGHSPQPHRGTQRRRSPTALPMKCKWQWIRPKWCRTTAVFLKTCSAYSQQAVTAKQRRLKQGSGQSTAAPFHAGLYACLHIGRAMSQSADWIAQSADCDVAICRLRHRSSQSADRDVRRHNLQIETSQSAD